jgi:hypothetical protein
LNSSNASIWLGTTAGKWDEAVNACFSVLLSAT